MNVTLRQLRAFLMGAKCSSFTEAAAKSFMSQPGYSLLIRQLEGELGLKLFDRTTRQMKLTTSGREFAGRLDRALEGLDTTLHDIKDSITQRRGRATVGVMPSIGSSILAAAAVSLARDFPDLVLSIREDQAEALTQMVADGVVDFAVSVDMSVTEPLHFSPILHDRLVGLFHPDEPLLKSAPFTWTQLSSMPYIAFARSSVQRVVAKGMDTAKVVLKPSFEITYVATAINLVRNGLGFAVVPELALELMNLKGVTVAQIGRPKITRTIGLLRHPQRSLTPAASAAADAFANAGIATSVRLMNGMGAANKRSRPK